MLQLLTLSTLLATTILMAFSIVLYGKRSCVSTSTDDDTQEEKPCSH